MPLCWQGNQGARLAGIYSIDSHQLRAATARSREIVDCLEKLDHHFTEKKFNMLFEPIEQNLKEIGCPWRSGVA